MTEGMEGITTRLLGIGLEAASLRHRVVATNIANANAVGYVPLQVTFGSEIELARQSLLRNGAVDRFALEGLGARIVAAEGNATGSPPKVALDMETARLSQNLVHYQALVKGLNKHLGILSRAASDGRK